MKVYTTKKWTKNSVKNTSPVSKAVRYGWGTGSHPVPEPPLRQLQEKWWGYSYSCASHQHAQLVEHIDLQEVRNVKNMLLWINSTEMSENLLFKLQIYHWIAHLFGSTENVSKKGSWSLVQPSSPKTRHWISRVGWKMLPLALHFQPRTH